MSIDNANISVHLGKTSVYKSSYDPSLLVREPRANNRTYLDIQNDSLPFVGFDTWNAYESSFLLSNGLPVAGVLKLSYPADSEYIVESKSLKLYLNSFNMTKLDSIKKLAILTFERKVSADLSNLLLTKVKVGFIPSNIYRGLNMSGYDMYKHKDMYTLEECISEQVIQNIADFKYAEHPDILIGIPVDAPITSIIHSGLLKSNCRVTSQPDWGDVYIHITSQFNIDKISLLKYIISFRDECHFHEEVCECIYKRLLSAFKPTELAVMCLYARRGGIDINPIRASSTELLYKFSGNLSDVRSPHVKTDKQ